LAIALPRSGLPFIPSLKRHGVFWQGL